MHIHRFAVGETVLCTERRNPHFTWKAPYTIITCLRLEAAEPEYRIASVHRHGIRVAGEHELCPMPQPQYGFLQSHEQFLALAFPRPANLNVASGFDHSVAPWLWHPSAGDDHI